MNTKRVFGPVPSRRLGRSIGINNIPPKICSYSCVYCQIGYSLKMVAEPQVFYKPEELAAEVEEKISVLSKADEKIDYLTIVPDGEPTLDANLGQLFELLKKTGIKTAIITNSTMLDHAEVRTALCKADWVSVKVDSVDEQTWRNIDKPHRAIDFPAMLKGIKIFSSDYDGFFATETMLVSGVNDSPNLLRQNASFIKQLNPDVSYLSIPTRPPADKTVRPPDELSVNTAYQIYKDADLPAEYLIGYEGNAFSATGNVADDILSITSVHPMREDAIMDFLKKNNDDFKIIETLIEKDLLIRSDYNGENFYVRKFKKSI